MNQFSKPLEVGKPKYETMSIWLAKNKEIHGIFHCFKCQAPCFKYQGELAMGVVGDATAEPEEQISQGEVMKAPFSFKCKGKSQRFGHCPMLYVLEGFVQ